MCVHQDMACPKSNVTLNDCEEARVIEAPGNCRATDNVRKMLSINALVRTTLVIKQKAVRVMAQEVTECPLWYFFCTRS